MIEIERILDIDGTEPVLISAQKMSFLFGGDHVLTVVELLEVKCQVNYAD